MGDDSEQLSYTVERGKEQGVILTPHLYEDGSYVASLTRYKKDHIRVRTHSELYLLAKQGYAIRMSNPCSAHHRAPSLILASSLNLS